MFAESGVPPSRAIRENLDALGLDCEVLKMDAVRAVDLLAREGRTFDFVFADPPYDLGLAAEAAVRVCRSGILAPRGSGRSPCAKARRSLRMQAGAARSWSTAGTATPGLWCTAESRTKRDGTMET